MRYDGPAGNTDQALAMAVNAANGDVHVTGKSANNTNDDFLTIKYSYSAVGIEDINTEIVFNVYPNPNSGVFFIDMSNNIQEDVLIEIINSMGQVVFSDQFSSKDQIEVNLTQLPTGVYIARIIDSKNELSGLNRLIIR